MKAWGKCGKRVKVETGGDGKKGAGKGGDKRERQTKGRWQSSGPAGKV